MITVFPDREALAQGAADLFAAQACQAVKAHGRFAVLLAGGETPRRTYQLLAGEPYFSSIPWSSLHFFWGDERCVPAGDPRSNAGWAQQDLLEKLPLAIEQIHPIRCDGSPQAAAAAYQSELAGFFSGGSPCFDLVLLGLGDDGHTASLLPGSAALDEEESWTFVTRRPEEEFSRVTLTAPLFNRAALVLFLVSGRNKAPILAHLLNDSPHCALYPAHLIQPLSGELRWFADAEAASLL